MSNQKENNLKQKIINEMTVDYSNTLEENINLAKRFIRITKKGKVDVLFKDKLIGIDRIMLYLIGKLYAKEVGFAITDSVSNKELMSELGIPKGSLLPWLKKLRDENKIEQIKKGQYKYHNIPINLIEKTLNTIEKKLNKILGG